MKSLIVALACCIALAGCSGMNDTQQRALTGTAIGAGGGAILGAIGGNAGLGAVAGAAAGLGATLVSRDAVRRLLAAEQLEEIPVSGTPMRRPWHAVTSSRPTAPTEVLVVHLLAQDGPPETRWRRPAERRGAGARPGGKRAGVPQPNRA